jgi:hypothetical protein
MAAFTPDTFPELLNTYVCPTFSTAEVLHGALEGEYNCFVASIERSKEMIRELDDESCGLSCGRNRRLQAVH